MILTEENYHSIDANMEYVSHSQIIDFCGTLGRDGCECMGLAKVVGKYQQPMNTSLMVGSYVDAALTGDLEAFKAKNPQIISSRGETKGSLKREYVQANVMIERAKRDPLFMSFLDGEYQVIETAEINGVKCKIKIDVRQKDKLVDLKTAKNMTDIFWGKETDKLTVAEYWGWDIEAALYQEVHYRATGELLDFYLAIITKESTDGVPHPRLGIVRIPQQNINAQKAFIESSIYRIDAIKRGEINPVPCGRCDWCADNLSLTERDVIDMDEMILRV